MSAPPTGASSKYDPNVIIKAAKDKLATNDMAGAQMMYKSALLDWVDDARESVAMGLDMDQMREAIATLWLAYANLNRSANMYKSATEAYEQAVSDPVAGSVGRIWLDYARFAEERGKLRTAQKVYLRALVGDTSSTATPAPAVTDEQDQNLLWNEFLEMMRKSNNNPSLTLNELKQAVQEHSMDTTDDSTEALQDHQLPEQVMSTTEAVLDDDEEVYSSRPEKRQKMESTAAPEEFVPAVSESKTYVVTAAEIDAEKTALLNISGSMPPELSGAWLARDGDSSPTRPEPPLFSASPPKLQDPTGKGILGQELALALITRLLQKDENDKSGTILLEVCRGCWLMTALKEKEAAKALEKLDQTMMTEMEALEANLEARISVAGAALPAITQMNDNERNAFLHSCNQRRQQLLDMIAWDFRLLLCVQQQILTKMQVPGFEGPTVAATALDLQARICSFLHSAFFLRSRIGEEAHVTMLKSQAERLASSSEKGGTQAQPPSPVAAGGGDVGGGTATTTYAPPPQYPPNLPPPPMFPPGQAPFPPSHHGVVPPGFPPGAPVGVPPPQQSMPPLPPPTFGTTTGQAMMPPQQQQQTGQQQQFFR